MPNFYLSQRSKHSNQYNSSTCAAGNCTSGTPPPVDWYVGSCVRPVPSTPDVCIFEHVSNQQAAVTFTQDKFDASG